MAQYKRRPVAGTSGLARRRAAFSTQRSREGLAPDAYQSCACFPLRKIGVLAAPRQRIAAARAPGGNRRGNRRGEAQRGERRGRALGSWRGATRASAWMRRCHDKRETSDEVVAELSLERSESQATLSPAGSPVYDGLKPQDNQSEEDDDDDVRRTAEENDGDAANVQAEMGQDATKEQPPQADAYDLWRGWSTHSFGDRSSSMDSADPSHEWRNLRSLSIDGLEDQNEALPLDSLANSLRSLRIGHSDDGVIRAAATTHATPPFSNRPRSFSDYTSALGSHTNGRSSWHETIGANALTATLDNQQHYLEAHASTAMPKDTVTELWKALKTNFATRHVLVKSGTMHFDVDDVQRISDMMHNYGSVARIRSELASEGLLLFTFFELRSAITAVKTQNTDQATSPPTSSPLFSPARTSSRGEMIHFALPYESPDDVNSATVLVTLEPNNDETSVTPTTMRQFCSHFGEVASVMQLEAQARNKFLVEFNDSRAVPLALHGLSSNGCKSISVVRAASSMLDVSKIQRFQECVEQLSVLGPMRSLKPRPKSFSSSSTSMLTSPTSSVASSLNASFMEGPPSSSSTSTLVGSDHFNSDSPTLDPTTPPGFTVRPAAEERIWSQSIGGGRVRSSSMYTQLSSSRGDYKDAAAAAADRFEAMGASSGRNSFPMSSSQVTCATYPPSRRSGSSRFSNEAGFDDEISGSELNEFAHQYQPDSLPSNRVRVDPMVSASSFMSATKFVPSNQYHEQYRPSTQPPANMYGYQQYGSDNGSGRSPPGQGRHDQGTGEFCLSIERVASGEDTRTTLMIRNIPNKYTQQMLLTEINQHHRGQYDFFYLPIDFKNKCNMGYAFINFIEARSIVSFYREFDGQKWTNFNSEKVCAISYARLQGKQAMIARFQNSSLLEKHESYRPLVFVSSGPNRGRPEHFPAPKLPSNGSFRKQSSPSQSFYSNTSPNYYQQHNQHSRHEEQYLPGMASARTYGISSAGSMLTHQNSQFNPYHSSQYYSHQQQASLLVMDPHQAQAILAAQMAAVAAIAPPRSSFRGFSQHESVRYQHPLHQYQQQQMQQRSSAYDLSERHQSGGYGSRSRYSS